MKALHGDLRELKPAVHSRSSGRQAVMIAESSSFGEQTTWKGRPSSPQP